MAKSLKITDAVNKNLKLVRDEDCTDTSLSLASENNGAKVTGDLNVKGGLTTDGDTKVSNGNIYLSATKALYFDGGGDTQINESSADLLAITVGGDDIVRFKENGADGNSVDFRDSCAGFTHKTAAFSDTSIIGSGGTHDTDIDFRHGNKYYLSVGADMTNMNLIFPHVSGNFLLYIRYDGDHDITNWKVYESDESTADAQNVYWQGGTKPNTTASGRDIFSFYWDTSVAFGVASLDFQEGS